MVAARTPSQRACAEPRPTVARPATATLGNPGHLRKEAWMPPLSCPLYRPLYRSETVRVACRRGALRHHRVTPGGSSWGSGANPPPQTEQRYTPTESSRVAWERPFL
jgi:hypothetical protein